jgi:hypothetical protein
MRLLYLTLSLAPSPLFFLGFLHSLVYSAPVCGATDYSMSAMWLVMSLAHLSPWILRWQQLNLSRD